MTLHERAGASDTAAAPQSWHPWRVAPSSGFEVADASGDVGLVQLDRKRFLVTRPFRFSDSAVVTALTERLVRDGRSAIEAQAAVDDARTFTPTTENPTDLASIPRFMRWFESSYGAHTLAAIVHDDLIRDAPNSGPLGDDTLSDRFFREMLRSSGVPWLKRWIMWSATALRSRWAVGGIRRVSVVAWLLLASAGIALFAWATGALLFDWNVPGDAGPLLVVAVALPLLAAALWGKQYGAGIVAAAAALWILPAAVLAGVGYLIYLVLEAIAKRVGLT
jgi:hypothetical protein